MPNNFKDFILTLCFLCRFVICSILLITIPLTIGLLLIKYIAIFYDKWGI